MNDDGRKYPREPRGFDWGIGIKFGKCLMCVTLAGVVMLALWGRVDSIADWIISQLVSIPSSIWGLIMFAILDVTTVCILMGKWETCNTCEYEEECPARTRFGKKCGTYKEKRIILIP